MLKPEIKILFEIPVFFLMLLAMKWTGLYVLGLALFIFYRTFLIVISFFDNSN